MATKQKKAARKKKAEENPPIPLKLEGDGIDAWLKHLKQGKKLTITLTLQEGVAQFSVHH